eukprot:scaffold30770_cov107-Isochrysis_galbana.AAC.1
MPRNRVGSVMPRNRAGSAMPRNRAGSAMPRNRAGSAMPRNRAGSAMPRNRVGSAMPQIVVGAHLPLVHCLVPFLRVFLGGVGEVAGGDGLANLGEVLAAACDLRTGSGRGCRNRYSRPVLYVGHGVRTDGGLRFG